MKRFLLIVALVLVLVGPADARHRCRGRACGSGCGAAAWSCGSCDGGGCTAWGCSPTAYAAPPAAVYTAAMPLTEQPAHPAGGRVIETGGLPAPIPAPQGEAVFRLDNGRLRQVGWWKAGRLLPLE